MDDSMPSKADEKETIPKLEIEVSEKGKDQPLTEYRQQRQSKWIEQVPKLSWIGLLIFIIILFSANIKGLFDNMSAFKGFGVEVELIKSSINSYNDNKVAGAPFRQIGPYQQAQIINRVKSLNPFLQSKTYKILWVDDHPENNTYIADILEHIGFKVEVAATTHSGLRLIKQTMTADTLIKKYDVAITDYARDNNQDPNGLIFADSARICDYAIPVIFFSGSYNEDSLGIPRSVFAIAHRPDFLINFVLDVVERGATPFPQSNVAPKGRIAVNINDTASIVEN